MEIEMLVPDKIEIFLGMNVEDSRSEIRLKNQPMVERLLKAFGVSECKQVAIPQQWCSACTVVKEIVLPN